MAVKTCVPTAAPTLAHAEMMPFAWPLMAVGNGSAETRAMQLQYS
jgi:hypothetical protein